MRLIINSDPDLGLKVSQRRARANAGLKKKGRSPNRVILYSLTLQGRRLTNFAWLCSVNVEDEKRMVESLLYEIATRVHDSSIVPPGK